MSVKVSYIPKNSTNNTDLWAHDPHSHTLDISYENVPSEREFYDLSHEFSKLEKNNHKYEENLRKINEDLLKVDKVLKEVSQNIISITKKQETLKKFIEENFSEGSFFFSEFSKILESHTKNIQKYVDEIKSYKNDILKAKKETLSACEEFYSNFKQEANQQRQELKEYIDNSISEIKRIEVESTKKITFQTEKFDNLSKRIDATISKLNESEVNLKKAQEEVFVKMNDFASHTEKNLCKIINTHERKIEHSLEIWKKLPNDIEDIVHKVNELKSSIKSKIDALNIQTEDAISIRESRLKSIDEQYALTMKKYDEFFIVIESFYKSKSSIFKRIKWLFFGKV